MKTENKVQHTPGALKVVNRNTINFIDINAGEKTITSIDTYRDYLEHQELTREECKANADHIVRCWNNHYALLEALRDAQYYLETAINATPTGAIRNILTEANIKALLAIKASEETT